VELPMNVKRPSTAVFLVVSLLLVIGSVPVEADSYQLTTLTPPDGANIAEVNGLNNLGAAVGYYFTDTPTQLIYNQGFIYQNNQFYTLPLPGTGGTSEIEAFGINDLGQVVGTYDHPVSVFPGPYVGFGFVYTNGNFAFFSDPNFESIVPLAINNLSTVVGLVGNPVANQLFTYQAGSISIINTPGYLIDTAKSVNDSGQIVGTACQYYAEYCFAYLYSNGVLTILNVPGSGVISSNAYSIDDSGNIRGTYTTAAGTFGFLDSGGVFTTFGLPQPPSGYILETMNSEGQIGGRVYTNNSDIQQAAIFTPTPEPRASLLLGIGLSWLLAFARLRKVSGSRR